MSGASVLRKLRATAVRFVGERKGNVAVIFALSAIPILTFVGAAIDYTRANRRRSSMQAALEFDGADAVEGSLGGYHQHVADQHQGERLFQRALSQRDAQGVAITATYTPQAARRRQASCSTATGYIVTDFMRVAGFQQHELRDHLDHQPGAMSACASRWCSTSPDRWPMTARWPR